MFNLCGAMEDKTEDWTDLKLVPVLWSMSAIFINLLKFDYGLVEIRVSNPLSIK